MTQLTTPEWIIYKYQLREAPPNVGYIGLTSNLPQRDGSHQVDAHLKRANGSWTKSNAWAEALRKHGRAAFELVVLERHETEESARAAEMRCITEHLTHTSNGGYNSARGFNRKKITGRTIAQQRREERNEQYAKLLAVRRERREAALKGPVELERAVKALGGYAALARRLDLSVSTVHGWVRRNSLPIWRAKEIADLTY